MYDDYTYIYLFFKLSCLVTSVFPEGLWIRATVTQSTEGKKAPLWLLHWQSESITVKTVIERDAGQFFLFFLTILSLTLNFGATSTKTDRQTVDY